MRHAQHEARHAPVPTPVCVAAVSQTLSVGQKVRTFCVPCIPSSAVLHPRYGMEAAPPVSFPQVGFLQLSCPLLEPLRVTLVEHELEDTGILEAWGPLGTETSFGTWWATSLVTGLIGIAVVCTVPFPYFFSFSLFPCPPFCALSFCLASRVFSWTLHFPGQCWARILEGIPVVLLRLHPERISERIAEQTDGCSSSRRIEQFSATVFAQEHSSSDSLS